jgi:hypothetical protein
MKKINLILMIILIIVAVSCKKSSDKNQTTEPGTTQYYESVIPSIYNRANSYNTTISDGISQNSNYKSTGDFKVNDNMYHLEDSIFSRNYVNYCNIVFQNGMMGNNMMNHSFMLNGYKIMNTDSLWNAMMKTARKSRFYKMDSMMKGMMMGSMMLNKSSSIINTCLGKMQVLRNSHMKFDN